MQSLQHEVTFAAASTIVGVVAPRFSEDELRKLFGLVYEAVQAALVKYDERLKRRAKQLRPPQRVGAMSDTLTVPEAAVHCRVCESVVRQWISNGLLPHYRVGAPGKRGKILIQIEDLDRLFASFKVTKKTPETVKAPAILKSVFKHLRFS